MELGKIKPLNLDKALQLYFMLERFLPETDGIEILDFIGTIIDNIMSENSTAWVDALTLMMNCSRDYILENIKPEQSLLFFTEGLSVNRILHLRTFCNKVKPDGR